MNLKYNEEGKLEFDLQDLLSHVKDEDKIALIESLSCEDAIIKHVTDQILDGFTENVYWGSCEYGHENPTSPMGKAKRRIAKGASELAKKQIEEMESQITREKDSTKKYRDAYYKMYHAWPRDYYQQMPQIKFC